MHQKIEVNALLNHHLIRNHSIIIRSIWKFDEYCFSKYSLLKKYIKIIYFYFLKFIFDINVLK